MKKAKKYIALLLAVSMVCTSFTVTHAAGISETETEQTTEVSAESSMEAVEETPSEEIFAEKTTGNTDESELSADKGSSAAETVENTSEAETNETTSKVQTETEKENSTKINASAKSAEAAYNAAGEAASLAETTGEPVSLMKGDTITLSTTLTGTVNWTSADTDIATVDQNGEVTGAALGKTTVTATDTAGNTETFEVSVSELQYFNTNVFDYKEGHPNTITSEILEGAIYLDKLMITEFSSGWGSIGIDKCGACAYDGYDNVAIGIIPDVTDTNTVVTYEKGISMHADGYAIVTVPDNVNWFSAVAAVNQCQKDYTTPSMTFTVTVNGGTYGGTVYTYVVGNGEGFAQRAQAFDINITGADSIKLEVSQKTAQPENNNNHNDHGVWADAKFTAEYVDQTKRMGQENDDGVMSINDYTYAKNDDVSKGLYFTGHGNLNKGNYTISGTQNTWTGQNGRVVTGIAKNELTGSAIEFNYTDPGLFTLDSNSAKDVFTNVQFPFVADPEGYYTFDSTQMDAAFGDGIGSNGAKMNWYNGSANYSEVSQTNGDKTGFFPFNDTKGKATYTEDEDGPLNYWFGMSMSVDFYMLNGGYMDEAKTEPIVFEFSGDDDVWIYIDGKLVMDLGGIHDMASGSINFGEDTITVIPADATQKNTTAVSSIFGTDWVNDNGIHSLQVFYLERGKGASNLKVKFNLPQKDQLVIEKVYDNTSAEGVEAEALLSKEFTFQIKQDETAFANKKYALFENGAMINKNLETDNNGQIKLKYGQRAVFSLEMPRPDAHTYDVEEVLDNGDSANITTCWETSTNNVSTGNGSGATAQETYIGAKGQYDRTNVDIYTYTFHNYRNTVLNDDTVVIDYGKEIDVNVFDNDEVYASRAINLSESTNTNGIFTGKGEKVAYIPSQFMDEIETTKYNVTDAQGQTQSAVVTVIPATTVYYEDDFPGITFSDGWSIDTSSSTSAGKVQDDGTVGTGNNYGYDSSYDGDLYYSGGSVHYIDGLGKSTTASFTFTGTGFDIISLTDNTTGVIRVVVKDKDENQVFARMVDTYYSTEGGKLYQIPVINCLDLEYGQYTVTITVLTETASSNGQKRFYLDAIRIYNPLGLQNETANDAYEADKEKNSYIKEIRNLLIEQNALNSVEEGFVYVDLTDNVNDISTYISDGPNNEVYLKDEHAICTTLYADKTPDSIQIGAKAPNGTSYIGIDLIADFEAYSDDTYGATPYYRATLKSIATSTDMYYDMADLEWVQMGEEEDTSVTWKEIVEKLDWSKGVGLVVTGCGDNDDDTLDDEEIVSLSYLKTTGSEVQCKAVPQMLSLIQNLKKQTEKENEDVLTIYESQSDKTVYQRSKNIIFTVKTSCDVTGIEIQNSGIKQKILKTQSVDNGDGTITWSLTTRASSKKGTYTYTIYAVNSAGEKSEPATLIIKTK
ncbi:MAG: NPCBM/NEW2 domain-containing protein [Blautia sp.]